MIVETIETIGGLYFRSILLPKSWLQANQHVHDYSHVNICAAGSAQFWQDGVHIKDVRGGDVVEIPANHQHHFVSLEPNTRLICVHDIASAESIKQKCI